MFQRKRIVFLGSAARTKGNSPTAAGLHGARVHKPHYSTVSVPQNRISNFRSPIMTTRSNKCTTSFTTFDGTGTGSGMPMGPIYYPTSWFSTAFIFAGASQSVPAVGGQNGSPSTELGKDHRQSVGPGYSGRIQTGSGEDPMPDTPSSDSCTKEPRRAYSPGGANSSGQGSCYRSPTGSSR